jgi:hypothetical protein
VKNPAVLYGRVRNNGGRAAFASAAGNAQSNDWGGVKNAYSLLRNDVATAPSCMQTRQYDAAIMTC